MAKLTIVTTTYNHEKYIVKALESFLMQKTNFEFEVMISDDGSTDGTREILKDYSVKYPNIIKPIFNEENLGPMKNFVHTLSNVKSEYVALCDGDDYWTDENKLQKQVDFLDNNSDFNICFHQTKIFFENNEFDEQIWPLEFKQVTELSDLLRENYIAANTVVYRWIFKDNNNLEEIFPENIVPGDYYLHLLHAKNGKIKYIPEIMSHYRRHCSGMWWLNAIPEGKEQFSIAYGYKFLNFYKQVEKEFNLDNKFFEPQKRDIISNAILSHIKNYKFEELAKFRYGNEKIFDEYVDNIVNVYISYRYYNPDEYYIRLPKIKKLLYLIFIDQSRLKRVIKNRLKLNK